MIIAGFLIRNENQFINHPILHFTQGIIQENFITRPPKNKLKIVIYICYFLPASVT